MVGTRVAYAIVDPAIFPRPVRYRTVVQADLRSVDALYGFDRDSIARAARRGVTRWPSEYPSVSC